jgi:hypothetical protein
LKRRERARDEVYISKNKMLPRILRSRILPSLIGARAGRSMGVPMVLKRTMIAAPKAGDPPLMSRRADRELPGTPPPSPLSFQLTKSKLM